ncbi:MAG TPA: hypothetical protein PLA69_04280 [Flavobacterium sp.]|nr:hypothetical protein [Flavobacterium sp.]
MKNAIIIAALLGIGIAVMRKSGKTQEVEKDPKRAAIKNLVGGGSPQADALVAKINLWTDQEVALFYDVYIEKKYGEKIPAILKAQLSVIDAKYAMK